MTDEQKEVLYLLRTVGASLKHVGAAMAESFNHISVGSKTPLQPLDHCLAAELPNLRNQGQAQLADVLQAIRTEMGGTDK